MANRTKIIFPAGEVKEKRSFTTTDGTTMYCTAFMYMGGEVTFYSQSPDFFNQTPEEGEVSQAIAADVRPDGKLFKPVNPVFLKKSPGKAL